MSHKWLLIALFLLPGCAPKFESFTSVDEGFTTAFPGMPEEDVKEESLPDGWAQKGHFFKRTVKGTRYMAFVETFGFWPVQPPVDRIKEHLTMLKATLVNQKPIAVGDVSGLSFTGTEEDREVVGRAFPIGRKFYVFTVESPAGTPATRIDPFFEAIAFDAATVLDLRQPRFCPERGCSQQPLRDASIAMPVKPEHETKFFPLPNAESVEMNIWVSANPPALMSVTRFRGTDQLNGESLLANVHTAMSVANAGAPSEPIPCGKNCTEFRFTEGKQQGHPGTVRQRQILSHNDGWVVEAFVPKGLGLDAADSYFKSFQIDEEHIVRAPTHPQ